MWKILNSPFVITLIAIVALFGLAREASKPKLSTEIRGAYDEINPILKDGKSDAEKDEGHPGVRAGNRVANPGGFSGRLWRR